MTGVSPKPRAALFAILLAAAVGVPCNPAIAQAQEKSLEHESNMLPVRSPIRTAQSKKHIEHEQPVFRGSAPANDECFNAVHIDSFDTLVTGTTLGATLDDVISCGTTNTAPGVWYTFTGNGEEIAVTNCLQSTFSDYPIRFGVYCGSCEDLHCVTGNADFCQDEPLEIGRAHV